MAVPMRGDDLVAYCNSDLQQSFKLVPSPYWTAEVYGLGKHIRAYGRFPSFLPLCIYTDHGPGPTDHPYEHELKSDAPTQVYHSPVSVANWKTKSSKPCYVLYSPFVFYRRRARIERSAAARGTIAFPAHTTAAIDDVSDIDAYARQLKELPAPFQPVSVCLHMHDINKRRHAIFEKYDLPVYTAGHGLDDRFSERFYDIIKDFRYGTSNLAGSYLYYCVEMGIPFSIYGNKQIFINKDDPNIPYGEYDPYKLFASYRAVHDLFNGLHTEISQEQKVFVETHLGIRDGVSRRDMNRILYRSFLSWLARRKSAKYVFDNYWEKARQIGHELTHRR